MTLMREGTSHGVPLGVRAVLSCDGWSAAGLQGVLGVPLLVADTAQLCTHVKVPCAHTVQCTEPRGSFARVLCAKLFALARLFVSGAEVFVIDTDAAVLSAEPFWLWRLGCFTESSQSLHLSQSALWSFTELSRSIHRAKSLCESSHRAISLCESSASAL